MSSKYDEIKTAADLVSEVSANGLSTEQDDINRAADIFGNTEIEELDRLANDIGRNNEHDEPDPHGAWSSSRKGTQETFYFIAFSIWNWRDATRFFNQHTNPETEKAAETEAQNRRLEAESKKMEERYLGCCDQLKVLRDELDAENEKRKTAESELAYAQQEIVNLKAKLYDMMVAGAR